MKINFNFLWILLSLCLAQFSLAMVSPDKEASAKSSRKPSIKESIRLLNFDLSRADSTTIKRWFIEFAKNHNKNIVNEACIHVSKVPLGGLTAEKVFLITSSCNEKGKGRDPRLLYALKIYKPTREAGAEIHNLLALKSRLRWMRFTKPWPRIVFPEHFFQYNGLNEEKTPVLRYAVLIHAAKGKTLHDWFKEYKEAATKIKTQRNLPLDKVRILREKQTYARRQLLMAADSLGQGLALMHAKHLQGKNCLVDGPTNFLECSSLCHKDPNMRNVFWDDKERRIYLIDVESMADKSTNGCMIEDISVVFGTAYGMNASKSSVESLPDFNALIQSFLNEFIDAYIRTYRQKVPSYHASTLFNFFGKFGWGMIEAKTSIRSDTHPHAQKFWHQFKIKFMEKAKK